MVDYCMYLKQQDSSDYYFQLINSQYWYYVTVCGSGTVNSDFYNDQYLRQIPVLSVSQDCNAVNDKGILYLLDDGSISHSCACEVLVMM